MSLTSSLILGDTDETTGNSIAFLLYELGRHPDAQQQVRSEVTRVTRELAERQEELTASHFERMQYTVAVIKVRLPVRA